jgi:hypothetical protein
MMWALFGFICAMVGAVLGFLMLALCVAARDNPRMQGEGEESEGPEVKKVLADFTAFDIQDDGVTRFAFDIRLADFQRSFGRIPVGTKVVLSLIPESGEAQFLEIRKRREEFISRGMDPVEPGRK